MKIFISWGEKKDRRTAIVEKAKKASGGSALAKQGRVAGSGPGGAARPPPNARPRASVPVLPTFLLTADTRAKKPGERSFDVL